MHTHLLFSVEVSNPTTEL